MLTTVDQPDDAATSMPLSTVTSVSCLLTSRDVAKIIGVAEQTLRKDRANRRGPKYVKRGKRCIRYRIEDVRAWMSANTVDPTPAT